MKTADPAESILCPSCLTPNGSDEIFCRQCGAPIAPTATLDPIATIQTESFLTQKALVGRPKLIVLIGIWLMFGSVFLASVYSAVRIVIDRSGFSDFVFFWAAVGLIYLSGVVLYRVTKNYLAA
jgi:hypothetical protein